MSPVVRPADVAASEAVDFEIPGIFRARAQGGRAGDIAAVERDLGPPRARPGEAPDVIVRFVDDLAPRGPWLRDGAMTGHGDGGVYFLASSGRAPVAWVSQGERWGEASIVCRRGSKSIPLLSAALDLAALRRGWVPLHGSAWVTRDGSAVLAIGLAGSGKTGALLAACEAGATPVGDDRILLSADGSRMVGLGRPIVVKDWHLAQLRLPGIGARPVRRALARASLAVAARIERHGSRPAGWTRRALGRLGRELSIEVDPRALTGGVEPCRVARPDVLVILERHRHPEVVAWPADPTATAEHVAVQVEAELRPALRARASQESARPGGGWREVARAPETAASILRDMVPSIPTYFVRHPHPCSLKQLDEVIGSLTGGCRTGSIGR